MNDKMGRVVCLALLIQNIFKWHRETSGHSVKNIAFSAQYFAGEVLGGNRLGIFVHDDIFRKLVNCFVDALNVGFEELSCWAFYLSDRGTQSEYVVEGFF